MASRTRLSLLSSRGLSDPSLPPLVASRTRLSLLSWPLGPAPPSSCGLSDPSLPPLVASRTRLSLLLWPLGPVSPSSRGLSDPGLSHLSADPVGEVADQEGGQVGQLLRLSKPADRDRLHADLTEPVGGRDGRDGEVGRRAYYR